MMRWIANENVSGTVIRTLRDRGHDVLSVKESLRGTGDPHILAQAQADERVLVTHDKDFGELAFRSHLPASCGIILFRFRLRSPAYAARRMLEILRQAQDWHGKLSVVEESRVRMIPMPGTAGSGENHAS